MSFTITCNSCFSDVDPATYEEGELNCYHCGQDYCSKCSTLVDCVKCKKQFCPVCAKHLEFECEWCGGEIKL